MPTHTYHRFKLNLILCDDLCPCLQVSLLVISPHMHSIWMSHILNSSNKYQFCLPCKEGNENPNGRNLHILLVPIPVFNLSTLIEAHSLPYMGSSVSVQLTGYRQLLTVLLISVDFVQLQEPVL